MRLQQPAQTPRSSIEEPERAELGWTATDRVSHSDRVRYQEEQLTGSLTSSHLSVLLSTNSPPMKFLVFPPIILVPFQSVDNFSAIGRASAFNIALGCPEVISMLLKSSL